MGDNFRSTMPINITFGQGEIPTSTKLQQGFAQARDANRLIEKAIGDLWNQGGSSAFENAGYRNYQANLARIFGSASVINPRVIYSAIPNYSDDISAHEGLTDFYLKYAPDGGNLITVGASTALVLVQEKTSRAACQTAGDYYIDGAHLFCVTPLDNGGGAGVTVTYAANVPGDTDFAGADGATIGGIRNFSRPEYNVIPDPMTTGWGGAAVMVQITSAGAGLDYWLVDLPAMDGTAGLTTNRPSELSPVGGMPITTRYRLPTVLAGVGAGNQIPEGFIYLWDTTTQSIVSGLTFSMTNPISTIQIHASPKQYLAEGNTRYALITVGLPLAVAFDNLRGLFHQHQHKRMTDDGGGQTWADGAELEHKNLSGLTTPAASTNYPTTLEVPAFTLSRWDNDDHGQYLHRTGSYGQTSGFRRDAQDNAMFGHFLLSSVGANGTDWCHTVFDSHRIYWGSVADGPYMYYNKSDNALKVLIKDFYVTNNILCDGNIGTIAKQVNNIYMSGDIGELGNRINDIFANDFDGATVTTAGLISCGTTIRAITFQHGLTLTNTAVGNVPVDGQNSILMVGPADFSSRLTLIGGSPVNNIACWNPRYLGGDFVLYLRDPTAVGAIRAFAPIHLPHGCYLHKVNIYGVTAGASIATIALKSGTNTGADTTLASVSINGTPAALVDGIEPYINILINNTTTHYWLELEGIQAVGTDNYVMRVEITYYYQNLSNK